MTTAPGHGHEERDIDAGRVVRIALAILGLVLFAMALAWVLTEGLAARRRAASPPPNPVAERLGPRQPPAPRLQTDPRADLQALRARDAERLSTYAWVDREAGVARIPIERAMALLAARGGKH